MRIERVLGTKPEQIEAELWNSDRYYNDPRVKRGTHIAIDLLITGPDGKKRFEFKVVERKMVEKFEGSTQVYRGIPVRITMPRRFLGFKKIPGKIEALPKKK